MLVTNKRWSEVKHNLSPEEREKVSCSVTGRCICPSGFTVSESILGEELTDKLRKALADK